MAFSSVTDLNMLFQKPRCVCIGVAQQIHMQFDLKRSILSMFLFPLRLNDRERKVSVILFVDVIIVCVRIKIQKKKFERFLL